MKPTVQLHSTLLVPAPQYAGDTFRWIDTLIGNDNDGNLDTVNIIVFNAKNKEEIKPLLEKFLKDMRRENAQNELFERNTEFVEKTINAIGVPGFDHVAPESLLDALAEISDQHYTADDVIYLSGVRYISQ